MPNQMKFAPPEEPEDIVEEEEVAEEGEDEDAAQVRSSWGGSDVTNADIRWLRKSRRIPDGVACRLPGDEVEPQPEDGERVVFLTHFERGFGLPVSDFMVEFLKKFELQPHHLPANAIVLLSAGISFSEAYLGLWPSINFWSKYFTFRSNVIPNKGSGAPRQLTQCGAAALTCRRGSIAPKIKGVESVKKWQYSFFYVKNTTAEDLIRLPEFVNEIPTKKDWDFNPTKLKIPEVAILHMQVENLMNEGLTGDDLLRTFVSRRVSPLQKRAHKMCHMSGRFDPTRMSTFELTPVQIFQRVRAIAKTAMVDEHWNWGIRPADRQHPLVVVSTVPPEVLIFRFFRLF